MRRRWIWIAAAALLAVGIAGGLAAWLWTGSEPHSIVGSSTSLPTTTVRPKPRPPALEQAEPWPTYGFDPQ
jgi:hypothetical protein